MVNKFRLSHPKRTCTKTYKSYRSFKKYLVIDFNSRCGYTDCPDFWFGGKNTFHIDHFKPKTKNPKLETEYSNLVYCCSYVNISKSDDEGDYLDPCDVDYNECFERKTDGSIVPITIEAKYMFKNLKLGLNRYKIIWMLDSLYLRMKKVKGLIEKEKNEKLKNSLLISQGELANLLVDYLDYLTVRQ